MDRPCPDNLCMSYGIKNKFLNPIMGVELTQPQVYSKDGQNIDSTK